MTFARLLIAAVQFRATIWQFLRKREQTGK